MARARINLTGRTFGHLTVLSFVRMSAGGQSYWLCECTCGTRKEFQAGHIKNGTTRSCGCQKTAFISQTSTKHGYWKGNVSAPEYSAWCLARVRCHKPDSRAFKDYGARGITMCERWRFGEGGKSGFECFIADMGDRPSPQHTLDRRDNGKGYSPENCRWATRTEQQRNTRWNRIVEFQGRTVTIAEAAQAAGISYGTLHKRIQAGMTADEAAARAAHRGKPLRPKPK